jgi:hypothetical protein
VHTRIFNSTGKVISRWYCKQCRPNGYACCLAESCNFAGERALSKSQPLRECGVCHEYNIHDKCSTQYTNDEYTNKCKHCYEKEVRNPCVCTWLLYTMFKLIILFFRYGRKKMHLQKATSQKIPTTVWPGVCRKSYKWPRNKMARTPPKKV